MRWADRELTSISPLNLEGKEIQATIRQKLIDGLPLDRVEDDVKALHAVLKTLRAERQVANGRRLAGSILLRIPEYQEHLEFLKTGPDIPDSLRQSLIQQFLQGENHG